MAGYIAIINVPGYLPMDDEPPVFETAAEAWDYLAGERERAEDDAPMNPETCEGNALGGCTCDEYSDTYLHLTSLARESESTIPGAMENAMGKTYYSDTGTIYGPTPGYDGEHDLGLAYSVTYDPEAEVPE